MLPCGYVGKRQEAVEPQQAAYHQEEYAYDQQPHNQEDAGFVHRDTLHALAKEYDELCGLQEQEPIEEHAVVLSDTVAQPRTMVVMSANAAVAILTMLHAKRLVDLAALTPAELLTTLHGFAALLVTLIGRTSTFLNSTSLNQRDRCPFHCLCCRLCFT